MLILAPFGKARQVIENILRFSVKNVRAVFMNENSCIVIMIVSVATDVLAEELELQRKYFE